MKANGSLNRIAKAIADTFGSDQKYVYLGTAGEDHHGTINIFIRGRQIEDDEARAVLKAIAENILKSISLPPDRLTEQPRPTKTGESDLTGTSGGHYKGVE